jgi:hypothetical protein
MEMGEWQAYLGTRPSQKSVQRMIATISECTAGRSIVTRRERALSGTDESGGFAHCREIVLEQALELKA